MSVANELLKWQVTRTNIKLLMTFSWQKKKAYLATQSVAGKCLQKLINKKLSIAIAKRDST